MRRRPCLAALCAVVILAAGSPSLARVGGPIKQVPTIPVPRLPSTPSAPESSTKEPEAMLTCDLLSKMIAGLKAERGALEKAAAEVKAVRARAAAGGENAQQERLMAVFQANAEKDEKYNDCLEAVMLKDPDYPKYERLEMQAEDELDEEKSAKLSEQAEALHDVIKKRAEPACASLKGDMAADMRSMAEEEQARRKAEEELISGVGSRAEEAGAQAAQLPLLDYAKLKEDLCVASLNSAKINSNDRALLDTCGADLQPSLRALGCGAGSPWGEPPPIK
jgi:hypothetical protein